MERSELSENLYNIYKFVECVVMVQEKGVVGKLGLGEFPSPRKLGIHVIARLPLQTVTYDQLMNVTLKKYAQRINYFLGYRC